MMPDLPNRRAAGACSEPPRPVSAPSGHPVNPAAVLWVTLFTIMTCAVQPVHAENFEPPAMEGYSLHSERDADGDGDGVNETHIKLYMNTQGDSMFSMTTNGRLWAWSLETHENTSGLHNYVIRDSDCDGSFDEVYGLDDEFHVPACAK
jgi:hypothetical protein